MRLKDRVAVITGAGQGIGLACAEAFVAEGAKVVIAEIDEAKGRAAAEKLGQRFIACDVGTKASVDAMIAQTMAQFGRLDVVVNNAAVIKAADILDLTEEDFDRVLRINLKGGFLVSQAAAREMVKAGRGAIINMSSVNGVLTIPNQLAYNVAKGGMNQMTRNMAVALAARGIRVNAIGPGSIMTDMLKTVMNDEAARKMILSRTPMGRCGEPAEIAAVAVFLASDESSYITGQCLYADGGRLGLNYTVPVAEG
ncbi:SDR family oxidoreductase [Oleomonas cavernae]|uniref:SDR family oxidoreductase n=1 Tax=Oleomonas cavernae TaxID=2320859 RepID=A0A418WG67_9PROT|nr:SDR family oxidoreductase [Oleomonas cavernae]RJF89016.1 SDR family oxidoreductase [Oleomonas cavernae]